MPAFRWNIPKPSSDLVRSIASELSVHPVIAQCLVNRDCHHPSAASLFLDPKLARLSDPFLLPNMDLAVQRLFQAHQRNERFVIFGDYDVDGISATALLTQFFTALGWHSFYYLPHRLEEGYGLTPEAVQNCLAKFNVKLILAVDCGSSSAEVIHQLSERGVDVIVLDHHQVASPIPKAVALVNPQLLPTPDPFRLKTLCSAGLAFKLAHALLKRARAANWPGALEVDLKDTLDLVALGTVADMVPLVGENRIFSKTGIEKLSETTRPGIQALKQISRIDRPVAGFEIAFQLAPRLNAAGRLETALDALELLLTSNPDRATALAKILDEQNSARQLLEKQIVDQVLSSVRSRFDSSRHFAIVEGDSNWHIGVVGIVASRVLREFHRPVIIMGSDGPGKFRGSGRSIEGFDLAAALRKCGDLLLKHGGHAMAAGLSLASSELESFRARLNEMVRQNVSPEQLQPAIQLDGEIQLSELSFDLLKALDRFEPTGQGNAPVQFAARNLQLCGGTRRLGPEGQHIKFKVTDGRSSHTVLWWNSPLDFDLPQRMDLAFTPQLHEYNGTFAIQLKALDIAPL